jgi:hypothetical protein
MSTPTRSDDRDSTAPEPSGPVGRGHVGLIVAASMFGGLILALVLTLLVFGGATEPIISGVALLAFALGWTLLAWLSDRRTDQPQRWAYVPATFMGVWAWLIWFSNQVTGCSGLSAGYGRSPPRGSRSR